MATVKDGKGTLCLASFSAKTPLQKHEIGRPIPSKDDVSIAIKFCGMCHSDLHATNGEWGINLYPMAPGHEIAGIVQEVGSSVTEFKVGDRVAVGCFVSSCRVCDLCTDGVENLCNAHTQTYSSMWLEGRGHDECVGCYTNGGYSSQIVVDKHFVFHVPENMELEYVGPLLCAGATMFTPIKKHVINVKNKSDKILKVGIVGFGGLGHIGAKIAKAAGADVTILSRSLSKADAAEKIGCDILAHTDKSAMMEAAYKFDLILDTVSTDHEIPHIMGTLKKRGTYVFIGGIPQPLVGISPFALIFNNWAIEGTLVGGVPDHKHMLEFCAENNVLPDIKVIHAKEAADHFKALFEGKGDAIRAVIDMSTLEDL